MIARNVVSGGPELEISKDLSFAKYVIDKLKEHCAVKEKVAMIDGETHQQTSYQTLLRKIVCIGDSLRRMGYGPGDTIALYSENRLENIVATVGALSTGATVTTLNVKYTTDETIHVLNISKPKLIFCSEAALKMKLNVLLQVSSIKHIVQLNGVAITQKVTSLDVLLTKNINTEEYKPEAVRDASDTALIFYSSGTTGLPKGVMLTHYNILHGTAIFNYGSQNKGNVLTVLPWYHVFGLLTTIQYIANGNLVVFLAEPKPDKYLATIEKYQITEMPVVPPIVVVLAKSPLVSKYDLSSVQYLWCAAAPISIDTISSAKKNLRNCKGIFQAYGLTETSLAVIKEQENSNGTNKGGSCGVLLPGVTAKVVDIKTREYLGPNQQGEICLKGPSMMKGYVDNEAATRDMFDDEAFLKTGDLGYYDEDGRFYIVDRLKEIIKYKGHQVAPAVVEGVIMQHEAVSECGVVGAPDELAGELPTAFVVKKPGVNLTEQELLDFTASRLSPMSRLRGGVIFIDEIPRNGSGKIVRRVLRDKLQEIKRHI